MGIGTYNFAVLRLIFDAEPEECFSCDFKAFTEGIHHDCDYEFKTKSRFPNRGVGEAFSTLQGPTIWHPSYATVTHKQVVVLDKTLPVSLEKLVTREVTLHGFIHAIFWHRIDIKDAFEIRSKVDSRVLKKRKESRSQKAYTPQEAGRELARLNGED
ncbi:hypothetical protein JMJ35_007411 [Cladonia borealis]|uniref:Uncharacterized protein n=1 Tax=Cladonia borealis TaxID=184061 RepID=A0AA39QVJ0_9LECA|nr:hypothetical protein JMJ35_007411 [Cladonia borealis]